MGLPVPVFGFIVLNMDHYQTHYVFHLLILICDNENSMRTRQILVLSSLPYSHCLEQLLIHSMHSRNVFWSNE